MEGLESVKAWALGVVIGPILGLLLWYFKRSIGQADEKLAEIDAELKEVRVELSRKAERTDITPVWEKLRLQDQDIKNLGAAFSRELREQIDTIRREQNENQRQTNERLDKIMTLMATERAQR